jgi:hypothetical protein
MVYSRKSLNFESVGWMNTGLLCYQAIAITFDLDSREANFGCMKWSIVLSVPAGCDGFFNLGN